MKELFKPDILQVFEHYGLRVLPSRGSWAKAECPMPDHADSNPSASVNEALGKFTCFSCGAKGDGLDVIEAREKDVVGVVAASRFAAQRFGSSDCDVRDEPRPSGGLLDRPRTVKRPGNWSPPWSLR